MDEPLCFVHFIITLTCFQNKKGCFCFSKYFEQTATWATPDSPSNPHLSLGIYTGQLEFDYNQKIMTWRLKKKKTRKKEKKSLMSSDKLGVREGFSLGNESKNSNFSSKVGKQLLFS